MLICGSGIGIGGGSPRNSGALVHDALGAKMCRQHNDANGLPLVAAIGKMSYITVAFLSTEFEGASCSAGGKNHPENAKN